VNDCSADQFIWKGEIDAWATTLLGAVTMNIEQRERHRSRLSWMLIDTPGLSLTVLVLLEQDDDVLIVFRYCFDVLGKEFIVCVAGSNGHACII